MLKARELGKHDLKKCISPSKHLRHGDITGIKHGKKLDKVLDCFCATCFGFGPRKRFENGTDQIHMETCLQTHTMLARSGKFVLPRPQTIYKIHDINIHQYTSIYINTHQYTLTYIIYQSYTRYLNHSFGIEDLSLRSRGLVARRRSPLERGLWRHRRRGGSDRGSYGSGPSNPRYSILDSIILGKSCQIMIWFCEK